MRATSLTLRVVSYVLWLPVSFHWPCNPRALFDFPGKAAAADKASRDVVEAQQDTNQDRRCRNDEGACIGGFN